MTEKFVVPYTIVRRDGKWTWIHDLTGKTTSKTWDDKEKARKAALAHFMQSRFEGKKKR